MKYPVRINIVLWLLLLCFPFSVHALQSKIDSLEALLVQHQARDTARVKLLGKQSFYYRRVDPNKGLSLAKDALKLSLELGSKEMEAYSLNNIGLNHNALGNYDSAFHFLNQSLVINRKLEKWASVSAIQNNIGLIHRKKGNNELAIACFSEALSIKEELNDKASIAVLKQNIGDIFESQGNYSLALEYYGKSLGLFSELAEKNGIADVLIDIGLVYKKMGDYTRAMDYYDRSYNLFVELGNVMDIAIVLHNKGEVYKMQDNYTQALDHYNQSQVLAKELEAKWIIAPNLKAKGETYLRMRDYKNALTNTEQALELEKEMETKGEMGQSHVKLANIYRELEQHNLAIQHALNGLNIAESAGLMPLTKDATEVLYQSLMAKGRYKEAIGYLEQHMVATDSMFNINKNKEIARMTVEFDVKQKEAENEVLRLESEARESVIERQRFQMIGAIVVLVLLLLFTGYVFRAWRIRRQLYDAIEKLNHTQSRWFTNIAHELRTPLTLITGPVRHFIEQRKDTLDQAGLFEMQLIEKNGERLIRLVNEILDFSKLESGQLGTEDQTLNLKQLTEQSVATFHSSFQDKGILTETDLPTDPIYVKTDSKKVETILVNLVGNALKFTDEGGKVTVALRKEDDLIKISVTDTGVGIKAEDLPKVFDRYYQVEQSEQKDKPTQGGSGIGLALSQELARLLGGELTVESEWGKGTTFTLLLPTTLEASTPEGEPIMPIADEPIIEEEDTEQVAAKGQRILLVEDNADMRRYITNLLTPDYQVVEAIDGQAALHMLNGENGTPALTPDLIISDIMMPRMDGFTFAKKLKETHPEDRTPFVFLTARTDEEDKLMGLRIGVDDYITKPFNQSELS